MTPTDFLQFLATGGCVAVVSWALSWALEKSPRWQALPSNAKQAIILGIALVIGLVAQALLATPALLAVLAPYIQVVIFVVGAWLATQAAHRADK